MPSCGLQKNCNGMKKENDINPMVEPIEETPLTTIETLRQQVREDDPRPTSSVSLKTILGGGILNAQFFRSQLWLILLVVAFSICYVAIRYQCQQDTIAIDHLEKELQDAKYKQLASSSSITEKCRESHILEMLKTANNDSLMQISDQPPYVINIPKGK